MPGGRARTSSGATSSPRASSGSQRSSSISPSGLRLRLARRGEEDRRADQRVRLVRRRGGPVAELDQVAGVEDQPDLLGRLADGALDRRLAGLELAAGQHEPRGPALADRRAGEPSRRTHTDAVTKTVTRLGPGRPAAAVRLPGLPLLRRRPLVAPLVVERVLGHLAAGVLARTLAGFADLLLAGVGLAGQVDRPDRAPRVVLPAQDPPEGRVVGSGRAAHAVGVDARGVGERPPAAIPGSAPAGRRRRPRRRRSGTSSRRRRTARGSA